MTLFYCLQLSFKDRFLPNLERSVLRIVGTHELIRFSSNVKNSICYIIDSVAKCINFRTLAEGASSEASREKLFSLIQQRTTGDMTLVKDQHDIQTIRELLQEKAQIYPTLIRNPYPYVVIFTLKS